MSRVATVVVALLAALAACFFKPGPPGAGSGDGGTGDGATEDGATEDSGPGDGNITGDAGMSCPSDDFTVMTGSACGTWGRKGAEHHHLRHPHRGRAAGSA